MSSNAQFGRSASLLVASRTVRSSALDLSALRFHFEVKNADVETPNTAYIRVYNPSDATRKTIIKEFDNVLLQAGYQSNVGVIFRGTIKQFKFGKENNVTSYLDLLCADGDLEYNFGIINKTFAAGSTTKQRLEDTVDAMGLQLDATAAQDALLGGVLPRGKVAFGLARTFVRNMSRTNSARWSIQDGSVIVIPLDGYLPDTAVKINSATGMIGVPEATDNGISVRCLLNPLIKVGGRIQLNNADVTATIVREQFFPSYRSGPTLVASTENDGVYRVLVAEHTGDTRGQDWYTDMTCLHVDPSGGTVKEFG